MKILLLQIIDPSKKELETSYPHLGLAYIASFVNKYYPDIEIKIKNSNDLNMILKEKPDILGISSVTQNFKITENIIKEISEKLQIPIILGGVHITCVPSNLPKYDNVIGVLGEGEKTFYELVKTFLNNNNKLYINNLKKIDGIIFYENKNLIKTKPQKPLTLSEIPLPNRKLLPAGSQVLFTSRGCPYRCKFCSSSAFWKGIRFFSPEFVIKEIEYILKLDSSTKNIILYDDLFIADRNRLKKIADLFEKQPYSTNLRFWGNATANLINDEVCLNLNRLNFDGLSFGFETGNNKMLKWLKGNQADIEKNKKAIELCQKYNLESHGSFMLGLPDETEQQMLDTLNFIKNEKFDKGDVLVCTPLPGTVFWDIAIKKGLVNGDKTDWSKLSIRYSGWFPESDDFILMTDKVSYRIFREIYEECASELLKRTKIFDEKRAEKFAKRVKLKDFFSKGNLYRAIKDPKRTMLYLKKIIKAKL